MYYLHSVLVKQLATEHRVSVIRTWPPELTDPDGGASTRSSPGPTPAVSSSPPLFRVMTRGIAGPCQLLRMRNIDCPVRSIWSIEVSCPFSIVIPIWSIDVTCPFNRALRFPVRSTAYWGVLSILWTIPCGVLTFPVHSLVDLFWKINLPCPFSGQSFMEYWPFLSVSVLWTILYEMLTYRSVSVTPIYDILMFSCPFCRQSSMD